MAKSVTDMAFLVLAEAEKTIAQCNPAVDMETYLRGSLMCAMLSVEIGHGTTRADLLQVIGSMYDILIEPTTIVS